MDVQLYIESGVKKVNKELTTYQSNLINFNSHIIKLSKDDLTPSNFTVGSGFTVIGTTPYAIVKDFKILDDGRVIVVGQFDKYNGVTVNGIVRLNSNGTIDNSFDSSLGFGASDVLKSINKVIINSDSTYSVIGNFTAYNGVTVKYGVKINLNGTYNSSITSLNGTKIHSIANQSLNKILIGGEFTDINGINKSTICRLNSLSYMVDPTFNSIISTTGLQIIRDIKVLDDEKILIFGRFSFNFNPTQYQLVARLNEDGSLDESFNRVYSDNAGDLFTYGELLSDGKFITTGVLGGIDVTNKYSITGEKDLLFFNDISFINIYNAKELKNNTVLVSTPTNINTIYNDIKIKGLTPFDTNGYVEERYKNRILETGDLTNYFGLTNSTSIINKIEDLDDEFLLIGGVINNYRNPQPILETVEVDETEYELLDLFDDENISIKLKNTDGSDLGKAFSDFTQNFTIPATDKNNRLVRYNYNSDINGEKKILLKGKILIKNYQFKAGEFSIGDTKFNNLKPSSHSISFKSIIFSLKDVVGDSTLKDLELFKNGEVWNEQQMVNGISLNNNSSLYVPMIPTNRVFSYGDGSTGDLTVKANAIKLNNLRPAVSFRKVFDGVLDRFKLNIDFDFKNRPEFYNLYMWMNSSEIRNNNNLDFVYNFSPVSNGQNQPVNHFATVDTTTNVVTVTRTNNSNDKIYIRSRAFISNLTSDESLTVTMRIVDMRPGREGIVLFSSTRTKNYAPTMDFFFESIIKSKNIPGGFSIGNPLKYKVEFSSDSNISSTNVSHGYLVFQSGSPFPYSYSSNGNKMVDNKLSLNLILPDLKVIDFLIGIIKLFNIEITPDKLIPSKMTWKIKSEIIRDVYDYTELIDIENSVVSQPKKYKDYILTYKENSFFSTEALRKLRVSDRNSKDFGQLIYTDEKVKDGGKYEVKSELTITPLRPINDSNMFCFYGFEFSETLPSKINSKDFLIFYKTGLEDIRDGSDLLGGIYVTNGLPSPNNTTYINRYNTSNISNNYDSSLYTNSLGYKDEVNENPFFIYEKNLFSNYYQKDIQRLYNSNTKLFKYEAYLTAKEILELNLENDIIIKNKKYSIEEIDLEVTSGKAKLVLMNYPPVELSSLLVPTNPLPPINFVYDIYSLLGHNLTIDFSGAFDSQGISGYEIEYKKSTDLGWLPLDTIATTNSFSNTVFMNMEFGVTYNFRFRTKNIYDMYSVWSEQTYEFNPTPPTPPTHHRLTII